MLKSLILILCTLVYCAPGVAEISDKTYITSTGSIFTKKTSIAGEVWTDPSGLSWTRVIGKFSNKGKVVDGLIVDSEAVKACLQLGAQLPTIDQFINLVGYFGSSVEELRKYSYEFELLFPIPGSESGGNDRMQWTMSDAGQELYQEPGSRAWAYIYGHGREFYKIPASLISVRCVL